MPESEVPRIVELKVAMGSMTDETRDGFVAPNLSEFTTHTARDLRALAERSTYCVNDFILTSMLRIKFPDPMRQLILNLLRRVHAGVDEYCLGRVALGEYFSGKPRRHSAYFRALRHLEQSIAQAYQACELLQSLAGPGLVKPGSGDATDRLRVVYNHSKHGNEKVARSHALLPVWLSNSGLVCTGGCLGLSELADLLEGLADAAFQLSAPDPQAAAPLHADGDTSEPEPE